jgi:phospholipid/cholesterol/gamma-HCH transport system substrate-binding protein
VTGAVRGNRRTVGASRAAARLLGLGAIVLVAIALAVVIFGGEEDPYEVTGEFRSASQLIGGEMVVVGGVQAGSVEKIELSDDNTALITFSVDDRFAPLQRGTVATVRSTSLAGIANRRVELTLPAAGSGGEEIEDGARLDESETVSEVDLDEVFNTLDQPTVADLKRVLKGFEHGGAGLERQANRGLHYFNPLLSTSRQVLAQLNSDRESVRRLLVDSSELSGTLAARSPEISELVANLNTATGAIGRQRAALTSAIGKLPDFMREANTTFVNLRAAADDLEPLIVATDPVAERLGPFFTEFRAASRGAVPTIRDLDRIVRRGGTDNDLVELTRLAEPLAKTALGSGRPDCGESPSTDYGAAADDDYTQGAFGEATCAVRNSMPVLGHFRAYTPELVGWFDDFSTSGTLDASGGIGRIAGTFNNFTLSPSNGLPELLSPVDPAELFGANGSGPLLDVGNTQRCPGALERDNGDGSTPFTDGGELDCDPSQIPVGP